MTVETTTKKVRVTGNDVATVHSFSPMVLPVDEDDLEVKMVTALGAESTLVRGAGATNYSVSVTSFPGTGSITYPAAGGTPLATGASITMALRLPITQSMDLDNQGGYFPDTQEAAFDRAMTIALQQQEELDRTIQIPVTEAAGASLGLPYAAGRASKVLTFDASGDVECLPAVSVGLLTLTSGDAGKIAVVNSTETSLEFLATLTDNYVWNGTNLFTSLQISNPAAAYQYVFAVNDLAADRTITLPLLAGNDTFVFAAHTQTLTNKTLTSPVLTTPQINDTSADHQYVFAVSELAGDRTVTLPLLAGNDTFVFAAFTQTLTNKTLTAPVIGGAPTAAGATWADLGAVTTIDINAGTIDGVTMATSDITVGAGKTLNVSAGTLTLASDQVAAVSVNLAAPADASQPLGATGNRFTNLFLSGAAYIGGTTSANALDDYEEGTWTPVVGGNASYTTQVGRYTKIGRVCVLWCELQINVLGTGSTTTISGLPFTVANAVTPYPGAVGYFAGLAVSPIFLALNALPNTTTCNFTMTTAAAAAMTNAPALFGNGARVIFTTVYEVSE